MEFYNLNNFWCTQYTRSASILVQGQKVNLCITTANNQNLTVGQNKYYCSTFAVTSHLEQLNLFFDPVHLVILQCCIQQGIVDMTIFPHANLVKQHPSKSFFTKSVPKMGNNQKSSILSPGQRVYRSFWIPFQL